MRMTLPYGTWRRILLEREVAWLQGRGPVQSEAGFVRMFVRKHHQSPIAWPTSKWIYEQGEAHSDFGRYVYPGRNTKMVRKVVNAGAHADRLLAARGLAEGMPAATVLRRLIRQYVEGVYPVGNDCVPTDVRIIG